MDIKKQTSSDEHHGSQSALLTEDIYRPELDTSGINEKKLIRKIDFQIIPWLTLLYLLNFLDRGSIGNAKVCQWS